MNPHKTLIQINRTKKKNNRIDSKLAIIDGSFNRHSRKQYYRSSKQNKGANNPKTKKRLKEARGRRKRVPA